MAALTVWKFETVEGAGQALTKVEALVKQQLLTVQDAVVVSWPADKKKPSTHQTRSLAAAGAVGGMFWGFLLGLIFFIPVIGMAIGVAMGTIVGAMQDYGISDDFIKSVRSEVTEGTSALFLLTDNTTVDKVAAAFKDTKMTLLRSNLSNEQEAKLRADFGE